jgi:tRNA-dihydrouridine synthase B
MIIGKLDIPNAVLLAPMEDVTDISFRLICKRLGADIVYGGSEGSMGDAARMAEALEPDMIDINCGCWVKNVAGHGSGAGLLRDLPRMARIISSVVSAVSIPVTVKTRLGWDASSIRIVEVARMVEDAGARALTIHCRTRSQGHQGDPDYSWIPAVKESIGIPIIVNGNIDSAERARMVFETTGCDAVMVARGAIHHPWIFREIKQYLSSGSLLPPPSPQMKLEVVLEHLRLSVEYKGLMRGVLEMRKHYSGYLRDLPGVAGLRAELMTYVETEPIIARLHEFFAAADGGVSPPQNEPLAA